MFQENEHTVFAKWKLSKWTHGNSKIKKLSSPHILGNNKTALSRDAAGPTMEVISKSNDNT